MVPRVLSAAEELRKEISAFDPALYSGADCARLAEALAQAEKACAAARARAAARAVACGAHQDLGYADGADWLAQTTGALRAEARAELETAGSLPDLPATAAALAKGELSLKEAAEVARGQAGGAGSEEELVALAKAQGLGAVREEVRKRRWRRARPRTWPPPSTAPATSATGATSSAWCASPAPCPPRWA